MNKMSAEVFRKKNVKFMTFGSGILEWVEWDEL